MHAKQKKRNKRFVRVFIGAEIILIVILGSVFFFVGMRIGEERERRFTQISIQEEALTYPANNDEELTDVMNIVGTEVLTKDILLVNKENCLPEDYRVRLLTLPDGVNHAAEEAYQPLCNMLKAGQKEGLAFEICSSYRDIDRQRELFDEDVNILLQRGYSYSEAYEEVAKETMPPGYSEHSTGLAFDIVALDYQMLDDGQELTKENQWLQKHCAEYGFILRYPKGKEDITSINYEPWHFRYVGKEVAEYIMEAGITLEEYLEL